MTEFFSFKKCVVSILSPNLEVVLYKWVLLEMSHLPTLLPQVPSFLSCPALVFQ